MLQFPKNNFNPLFLVYLLTIFGYGCNPGNTGTSKEESLPEINWLVDEGLQKLLDSSYVYGAVLILDPQKEIYITNNVALAKQGKLPASTFKIPNSIIALETKTVENDSTMIKWDGKKRELEIWEKDFTFREALHASCVPCYQTIARKVGPLMMNQMLEKLNYPGMDVEVTNIDRFWLEGKSSISPFQQIDFLRRFYQKELNISTQTFESMRRMLAVTENNQYRLSGKSGWSITNDKNNGWYIGFVEVGDNTYYFATNISPNPSFNMKKFAKIRKTITLGALNKLKII